MLLMWIRKSTKIWWKRLKVFSGGHTEIQDRLQENGHAAAHMEFEKLQNFAIKLKRLKQL